MGLPLARTALAWQRTALSAAGLCVAGAVVWTRLGLPGPAVAAAVVAVLPMVALTRRGALAGRSVWDRMLAVVGAAVVLAVLGVAAAVLGLR